MTMTMMQNVTNILRYMFVTNIHSYNNDGNIMMVMMMMTMIMMMMMMITI